jgi:hypothetical protein
MDEQLSPLIGLPIGLQFVRPTLGQRTSTLQTRSLLPNPPSCSPFLMFSTISGNLLLARSKPRNYNYMEFWSGIGTFLFTDFHRFSAPAFAERVLSGHEPTIYSDPKLGLTLPSGALLTCLNRELTGSLLGNLSNPPSAHVIRIELLAIHSQ